ncbi:MAG: PAS domain S-box protein [Halobacteriales archaeon]|nr:PAS domain S-box protein [Halobacteriales archaeon]
MKDTEGRYVLMNQNCREAVGLDHDEAIGATDYDIFSDEVAERFRESDRRVFEEGKTIEVEEEVPTPDGTRTHLTLKSPVFDEEGEPYAVCAVSTDITGRRRRERELTEQQQMLETVLSNVPVVLFALDEDGVFTRSQGKALDGIGLEPGEVVGESVFELYDGMPEVCEHAERALEGESVQATVENSGRTFETWYEPLRNGGDTVTGVVGLSYDITGREEREEELERYETFIENASDVIAHLDEDGTILYQSPSVERVFGYEQHETVGDNVFDYVHPDDREGMIEEFYSVLNEPDIDNKEVEFRLRNADGDYVWVEATGSDHTDTMAGGFVVNSREITDRKEREKELEMYEALVENTSDMVTLVDEEGTILYQSPSAERILGYDSEEAVGNNVFEFVHIEDRGTIMGKFSSLLEEPGNIEDAEYRFHSADGNSIWIEASVADRRDTELDGFLIVSRDVTERKERENELRSLTERLDLAVEGANLGIWDRDIEAGEATYNDRFLEILGISDEEAEQDLNFWEERIHPDDLPRLKRGLKEHYKGETERYDIEHRIRTADGDWKWLRSMGHVVERGEDGRAKRTVGVHVDISERKKREEELRKTKERLNFAVEGAKLGIWDWDVEADKVEYNDRWAEMLGMSSEDADYDMEFREENAHPDDLPSVNRRLEKHLAGETDRFEAEYRMRTAEGDWKWIRTVGQVVERGEDGRAKRVVGVHMDIDERKRAERALEEERDMFAEGPAVVFKWGAEEGWPVEYVSENVEDLLGYTKQEMENDNAVFADMIHDDDLKSVEEQEARLANGELDNVRVDPYRVATKDGETRWVMEITKSVYENGELDHYLGYLVDVTARKERERELERYEAYIKNSSDSITHINDDGTIIYRNPSTERVENEPEEMEGSRAFGHVHSDDEEKVREAFESVLRDPDTDTVRVEYRSERSDDTYEWVEAVATDQTDTEVGGVIANTRVIEERKEREKELERYETFIQNSSDILTHLDEDGTILYQSPSAVRILGHEHGERVGDNAFDYVHPDDMEPVFEKFIGLLEGPEDTVDSVEMRYERDDGSYVWLEITGTDQRDTEFGGVIVNSREITERKRYEEELERSQGLLKGTEQIADTGGWEADLQTDEVRWTAGMYEIFGVQEGYEPTLEDSVRSYHPDDRDTIRDALDRCGEDGEPFDEELRIVINGETIWVHVRGEPLYEDGEVTDIRGSVRDITEMKERERELERSQDLLHKTERIADTGGWEADLETGEQRWTEGTYRIHGVSNEYEPTVEDGIEFYHPEDREEIRRAVERCRDDGEPYDEELRFITAEGELRWIRASGEPVYENGEIVRLRGSIRDITERKERELELLRNNKAVRELYEITADPDLSFEHKIEMVLESCRSRLGVSYAFVTDIDEQSETQTVTNARGDHDKLQPGKTYPLEESYCRETIDGRGLLAVQMASEDDKVGQEAYDEFGLGCYVGAKLKVDGELHGTVCFADTEQREEPFTEFERTLVELVSNWISYELERQRSKDRLKRQKDRLDDFASVVSHDLRSPLTVLNGNLQLAEETGDTDYFDSCRDAVERMEQLTDDLLSLARDVDGIHETEDVSIPSVVDDCWNNTPTGDAELCVETDKEVFADKGKLRLLLDNLIKNAVEHGGDDVTVTVTEAPDSDGFRVVDDGDGIPEDERDRVLEAGYSTRDDGTGLGMYIVKQVADAHGWEVEVGEGDEGGAAFDVTGVDVEAKVER